MKNRKTRQNSLSRRIVSLTVFLDALFLIIIMAVISFIYIANLTNSTLKQVETESINVEIALSDFVNDTLTQLEQLAQNEQVIGYFTYLQTGGQAEITNPLQPEYQDYYDTLFLLDSIQNYGSNQMYDFIFLASEASCSVGTSGCFVGTAGVTSGADWNIYERPWFLDLGEQDFIVSSIYTDAQTGDLVLTFVKTVYNSNQETIGYLGIDILTENVANIIYEYNYHVSDTNKSLVIFSQNENTYDLFYFSQPQLQDYVGLSFAEIESLDSTLGYGDSGMGYVIQQMTFDNQIIEHQLFGMNQHLIYHQIENTPWVIAVLFEYSTFLTMELTFIVLIGTIFVMMIVVSILLRSSINKTLSPIDNILQSIESIKNGNYDVSIRIKEQNELKEVADAINIMSKEISKQVDLVYQNFMYDPITGLKNRKTSHQEIDETILKPNEKSAFCLISVDNLQNIHVTKGQLFAEELVKSISLRLKQGLRKGTYLFSNRENEFLLVLSNIKSLEVIETEILRMFAQFTEPFLINNLKIEVKLHLGIALYQADGKNTAELMKKCDTALFKARQLGLNKFVFYNDQITREVNYRAQISEELSKAIENKELYMKYQPLVDNHNEIYGFEALVRWNSPTLGEISPQIFIADAENSQQIIPIGLWILEESCKAQVAFKKHFNQDYVISVNVSPVQILQKDFIDSLKKVINDTDIDPKYLVIEITEGVLLETTVYLDEMIKYVHEIGARIALDDFGTGYASLTSLRKFPFDNLKIDKSFVDGIFENKKDHSIIKTIVDLVHSLDMKIIAEGVETRKQYEYLRQIKTDVFQGYLFSKPLSFKEAVKYIDQFYKVAKTKRVDVFASKDYSE